MGVDISFKGIYGFRNSDMEVGSIEETFREKYGDDKAESILYDDSNGVVFVPDCMCGEYEYFGLSLIDFDDYDSCEADRKTFPLDYFEKLPDMLKEKFDKCGFDYNEFVEFYGQPQLWFFVHAG